MDAYSNQARRCGGVAVALQRRRGARIHGDAVWFVASMVLLVVDGGGGAMAASFNG